MMLDILAEAEADLGPTELVPEGARESRLRTTEPYRR